MLSRLEVQTPEHLVRWLRHQVVHQPRVDNRRVLAPEDDGEVGNRVVRVDTLGTHPDRGAGHHDDLPIHLVHTEEARHRHPIVEEEVDQSTLDLILQKKQSKKA